METGVPEYSTLRVAVVGGCHVSGISLALRALLPGATVNAWHVGVSLPAEKIAEEMPSHDVIVTQGLDLSGWGDLEITKLREKYGATKRVVFVPTTIFTGLHPDLTHVDYQGDVLNTPMGTMHSVIAIAAYTMGINPYQTARLFNAATYEKLGYMNSFQTAAERLIEQLEFYGYNIVPHLDRWLLSGAFMHTANHPRIDVLSSLATLAAIKAELIPPDTMPPEGLTDYLGTHERCPVYPEIAKGIGFDGSLIWHRSTHLCQLGESREWSIDEAVYALHTLYDSCPGINLLTSRVKSARAKMA
jgi:hypothetical protein